MSSLRLHALGSAHHPVSCQPRDASFLLKLLQLTSRAASPVQDNHARRKKEEAAAAVRREQERVKRWRAAALRTHGPRQRASAAPAVPPAPGAPPAPPAPPAPSVEGTWLT